MKTFTSTLIAISLMCLGHQASAWQAETDPEPPLPPQIEAELTVQESELQPPQEGELQEPEFEEMEAIELPVAGGMDEQILAMQKEALNKEFQWLESELDLSSEAIERIKEAFDEPMKKTVEKRVKRMQEDGMYSYPQFPNPGTSRTTYGFNQKRNPRGAARKT